MQLPLKSAQKDLPRLTAARLSDEQGQENRSLDSCVRRTDTQSTMLFMTRN